MVIIVGKECSKDIKYLEEYSNKEYPAKMSKDIKIVFHKKDDKDRHIFLNSKDKKVNIKKLLDKHNTIFRYGCRAFKLEGFNKVIYNKSKSIKLAGDKYASRMLFKSINIPIPTTYSCCEIHRIVESGNEINFPLIRRPLKHSKSNDFIIIDSEKDLIDYKEEDITTKGFYYSEFIDKVQELRVHVAHGKVISVIEKRPPTKKQYSWGMVDNFDNVRWNDWQMNIIKSSVECVKILGLTFGAVDVIVDNYNNYYILEVNTAPDFSYSNYLTSKMIKYFNWVSDTKDRKVWQEVEEDKASNFAWKKTDF